MRIAASVQHVNTREFHQLLLDAATGNPDALERLRMLVSYGECIERAFIETPDARMVKVPLKLVSRQTDQSRE